MQDTMYAVMMMGGLGLLVGIGLAVASKVFYVYVDPLVAAIDDALPGANCGGCGLPGCSANAEAIAAGKAAPNSCVAGGEDLAATIAGILGVSVEAREPDIALPGCTYGVKDAAVKYTYDGLGDCRAAALLSGGMKVCEIGCLGLGTCAKACPFGAIVMGDDGLPKIDEERCTGCGTCEKVCPKHIITLSSVTRRIIKEYTSEDCTTPCQRACPAGIDICAYIGHIADENYRQAVQVIKERNPFPTVIGRICPRPCENECRRKLIDEPVAINFLKRFAADEERSAGERVLPFKAPATGRKVAVVGGGISGLSAAFFAARLGHEPTVFEATDKLGGLLRTAIAMNRLPHDILDWDIQGVLDMGVSAQTGVALGKDFSIDSLFNQGFEAVYLASGGWDNRLSRGAGAAVESVIPGVYLLIDLLKGAPSSELPKCEGNVVIAGGDALVIDAIRVCKKQGAKQITVLQRESEEASALSAEDVRTIKTEGVELIFNAGIQYLFGASGQMTHLEYIDLDTNKSASISAETLFLAAGRFPELIFAPVDKENIASGWKGVQAVKPSAESSDMGLLANIDTLTDFSAAIRAIAAGRRGAATVHMIMYDIPLSVSDKVLTPVSIVQNVNHVAQVSGTHRQIMPICSEPQCRELELGFSEEMAKTEAKRCLQCGLVCYKQTALDIMANVPSSDTAEQAPPEYELAVNERII